MSLAPGWYRDPAEPTTQRWWDGEGWVGDPIPADQEPPPGPPPESESAPGADVSPQVPAVPGHPGTDETAPGARAGGREPGEQVPPRPGTRQPGPEAGAGPWLGRGWVQASFGDPPRPYGHALAPLGTRVLARLVDLALIFLLNVVVNGWFVYQLWLEVAPVVEEAWRRASAGQDPGELPSTGDEAGYMMLIVLLLGAALWFAYEVPAVANSGQTPGKRLLGLKVIALEQQQPLSFARSFRRWNTMGLPTLLWWCFGIGFLLQLVDAVFMFADRPLHQALHDKSALTAVVATTTARPSEDAADEPPDSR